MYKKGIIMDVKLQKMTFSSVYPRLDEFYSILSENRARLKPWFWWANEKVTPNKFKFALFISLYLCDTKRKEIAHKFNFKKLYDEQFLIYADNAFRGMIGLDNIDNVKSNAELWGWIARGGKASEIVDVSLESLEDYCISDKKLKSLYAKTQTSNQPVKIAAVRNGYQKIKTEYGVRVSRRNPNISDIITWEKQLVK